MTLARSLPSPPNNDAFYEKDGVTISQSWQNYFQALGASGVSQSALAAAEAAAIAAQTTATGASTAAAAAQAQIDALVASPPLWVVGDYRPTSLASLGANWLPCDGSSRNIGDYPALSAVIRPITGGLTGTFNLPGIAPQYDPSHPAPAGPPILQWFIRAL